MLRNLGRFKPTFYNIPTIEIEFSKFMLRKGYEGRLFYDDVRSPSAHCSRIKMPKVAADEWHQDTLDPGNNGLLAVWANIQPTEIRGHEKLEAFHVYIFPNAEYYHRRPSLTMEEANQRWFARMYIERERERTTLHD